MEMDDNFAQISRNQQMFDIFFSLKPFTDSGNSGRFIFSQSANQLIDLLLQL